MALVLPYRQGDALSFFPRKRQLKKKELIIMNILKQFLFIFAVTAGLCLAVSAQKDDPKNRPPKDDPPVIKPEEKPRPPKDTKEEKPKKPSIRYFALVKTESDLAE